MAPRAHGVITQAYTCEQRAESIIVNSFLSTRTL